MSRVHPKSLYIGLKRCLFLVGDVPKSEPTCRRRRLLSPLKKPAQAREMQTILGFANPYLTPVIMIYHSFSICH